MNSTMIILAVLVNGLCGNYLAAQGTLYVSNLDQTPAGSAAIGSDSWIAQGIYTGSNLGGYILNSMELLMDPATGSPDGFTVSVFDSAGLNSTPGVSLGTLRGPDPALGGSFSYSGSDLLLSRNTQYYVVVSAAKSTSQGAYFWDAQHSFPVHGAEEWVIDNLYGSASDGLQWTLHGREKVFQLAIYATPVPEPSSPALLGLGGLLLAVRRVRAARAVHRTVPCP